MLSVLSKHRIEFLHYFFSDKNSPCCQNCAFMRSGVKCRDAQYATCEQESRCTGASSECPRSPAMKNGTGCLERGQCRLGKCVPYCETQGLQSCMCDTSKRLNFPLGFSDSLRCICKRSIFSISHSWRCLQEML